MSFFFQTLNSIKFCLNNKRQEIFPVIKFKNIADVFLALLKKRTPFLVQKFIGFFLMFFQL